MCTVGIAPNGPLRGSENYFFVADRGHGEEGEPEELLDASRVGRVHRHPGQEGDPGQERPGTNAIKLS